MKDRIVYVAGGKQLFSGTFSEESASIAKSEMCKLNDSLSDKFEKVVRFLSEEQPVSAKS